MTPDCLNPQNRANSLSPPLDVFDLSVRLETEGVTDTVARGTYGYASTWDMADAHYPVPAPPRAAAAERGSLVGGWVEYFRGASFALPLLICCAAMLVFHFSLWGGALEPEAAVAVAVGTLGSFVVSGGFIQAMARRGLFYFGCGQFRMCAASSRQWLIWGAGATTVICLLGMVANASFDWMPASYAGLAAVFFLGLSFFWLAIGLLYILKQNLLVSASVLIGIAVVVLLHAVLKAALLPSQVAGLLGAIAFAVFAFTARMGDHIRRDSGKERPLLLAREVYLAWPYFVYGFLYYLFLFADRILAWTAGTETAPFAIQFRGDYETALDIGLFAFMLQVGWVHYALTTYHRRLKVSLGAFSVSQADAFSRDIKRFYGKTTLWFFPVAAITTLATYFLADQTGFLEGPLIRTAAMWSLLGFPFLVVGLWNASLLFALSRPMEVLISIGSACLANLALGYLASRVGSYQDAIMGFAAGALLFAVVSGVYCLRTFRRLDYYQYTAAL
ncbi:MAG: exopolysaccharide Pel transporter PelG [Acidobacteria bacterium]|nr:exopolysaccharide Pel transporter PelG [Acidobacteriota bacterium]